MRVLIALFIILGSLMPASLGHAETLECPRELTIPIIVPVDKTRSKTQFACSDSGKMLMVTVKDKMSVEYRASFWLRTECITGEYGAVQIREPKSDSWTRIRKLRSLPTYVVLSEKRFKIRKQRSSEGRHLGIFYHPQWRVKGKRKLQAFDPGRLRGGDMLISLPMAGAVTRTNFPLFVPEPFTIRAVAKTTKKRAKRCITSFRRAVDPDS